MKPLNDFSHQTSLKEHIRSNLTLFKEVEQNPKDHRFAAVALTVYDDGDESAVLVTRRSPRLKEHSGQWALPGGRIDDGEDAKQAALRELHEEINLRVPPGQILGQLDDYITRSGYVITPIVAWAETHHKDLTPNPAEVASIHGFNFSELNRNDSPNLESIPQSDRQVLSMNYLDDVIYAPTAAMLYQFREVVIRGQATRVLDFDQPLFAWR